jgi:hypothetical protein
MKRLTMAQRQQNTQDELARKYPTAMTFECDDCGKKIMNAHYCWRCADKRMNA